MTWQYCVVCLLKIKYFAASTVRTQPHTDAAPYQEAVKEQHRLLETEGALHAPSAMALIEDPLANFSARDE